MSPPTDPGSAGLSPHLPQVINVTSRSHLYVVYKSHFHAAGNFIGVHAEGKHVIQVGGHVFFDLLPFNLEAILTPFRIYTDIC